MYTKKPQYMCSNAFLYHITLYNQWNYLRWYAVLYIINETFNNDNMKSLYT